jgi:hypothetical protein
MGYYETIPNLQEQKQKVAENIFQGKWNAAKNGRLLGKTQLSPFFSSFTSYIARWVTTECGREQYTFLLAPLFYPFSSVRHSASFRVFYSAFLLR